MRLSFKLTYGSGLKMFERVLYGDFTDKELNELINELFTMIDRFVKNRRK